MYNIQYSNSHCLNIKNNNSIVISKFIISKKLLQEAFLNDESIEFHLLYSNRQEDDILLKETIRYMSKKSQAYSESERAEFQAEFALGKNEDRKILDFVLKHGETNKKNNFYLKFYNTLTRVNDSVPSFFTGKVTEDLIKILLPPPEDKTLIMLCGRGKMCKKFLTPILLNLGHQADNVFTFFLSNFQIII